MAERHTIETYGHTIARRRRHAWPILLCFKLQSNHYLYLIAARSGQPYTAYSPTQWQIQGGKSGHFPNRSWQWSLLPLGGRKSNDSIVNLWKCKDFGPLVSMSATDLPPYRKIAY